MDRGKEKAHGLRRCASGRVIDPAGGEICRGVDGNVHGRAVDASRISTEDQFCWCDLDGLVRVSLEERVDAQQIAGGFGYVVCRKANGAKVPVNVLDSPTDLPNTFNWKVAPNPFKFWVFGVWLKFANKMGPIAGNTGGSA